jgi:hypothetical protein
MGGGGARSFGGQSEETLNPDLLRLQQPEEEDSNYRSTERGEGKEVKAGLFMGNRQNNEREGFI